MNMQDAADRADVILDEVFEEIHPEVQWTHGPTTIGSCDLTRRRTVMTIVSRERRGSLLGLVDRFWRKSEYRIKAVNRDVEFPAIYAQTKDGFGVSLSIGGEGQAFFEVDSPCVKESEVADPITKPNGPSYADAEIIPAPTSAPTSGPPERPDGTSSSPMTHIKPVGGGKGQAGHLGL